MIYDEFKDLRHEYDSALGLEKYFVKKDSFFVMDPLFYSSMKQAMALFPNRQAEIIRQIIKITKKNQVVAFIYDYEELRIELSSAIYLEIQDVLNSLKILVEDRSRGSDYGD